MTVDRRRYIREVVNSPVYVSLGSSSGILYDLSEGGLAVDVVGSPLANELIFLGFGLPDSSQHIEGNAQIAWTDGAGNRAGLRFVNLPESSREQIRTWLSPRIAVGVAEETVAAQPRQEPPRAIPEERQELVTDLRSALFQRVEPPDTKRKPRLSPEEDARILLRRRKLILTGMSACFAGLAALAGVAGVSFFQSNRTELVAEFGEFKKEVAGLLRMSDAGPESKSVAPPSAVKPQRRHNGTKGQSATPEGLAKAAKPFEVEVMDAEGQRHLVRPRAGGTSLRLQFQGPSWKRAPANPPRTRASETAAASAQPPSPSAAEVPGPAAGRISRETSGDVPTQQVMPAYPLLALQKNVQGRVVLQVTVAKDGSVQNVRLVSGHPILATAVVDAVKQWRYKPTYRDGEAIEVERRITVDFVISTD